MVLEYFLVFFLYFFLVVMVLISVAFITLMEQNVLGSIQVRLGPFKVGYCGFLQPFADAVKLFTKEMSNPRMSNFFFFIMPMISLFVIMVLWMVFPMKYGGFSFCFGLLFFICVSGMSVFPIMAGGWLSNCKYSLLGGLRSVAQMISYEVSLSIILLSLIWMNNSFDLLVLLKNSHWCWGCFVFFPLCFLWFVSSLAETNRTPFDFSEGESELVSGFNTEYSGGSFTLIFIAEYASIIFMSLLFSIFFFSSMMDLNTILKSFFFSFMFIWVRGTMPRYRYDKLMYLSWKSFLPIGLSMLLYYLSYYMY